LKYNIIYNKRNFIKNEYIYRVNNKDQFYYALKEDFENLKRLIDNTLFSLIIHLTSEKWVIFIEGLLIHLFF
jgi:hypothetical protein